MTLKRFSYCLYGCNSDIKCCLTSMYIVKLVVVKLNVEQIKVITRRQKRDSPVSNIQTVTDKPDSKVKYLMQSLTVASDLFQMYLHNEG